MTTVLTTEVVVQAPAAMEVGAWICPSVIWLTPAWPDGQGRVIVVEIEMVVIGAAGAGVGAGAPAGTELTGCCGEFAKLGGADTGPEETGAAGELGVDWGVGMRVIVEGMFATTPGFWATWGAQMPAR